MDMTERPDGPPRTDGSPPATPPGAAGESAEQPARRPSPGPSATSRARRASAAGVEARRPSPRPTAPTSNGASPSSEIVAAAAPTDPSAPTALPYEAAATEQAATRGRAAGAGNIEPADDPIRRRSPLWLAIVLALLVLAGVAALLVVLRLPSGAGSVEDRDRALSAAKTEVPLILSYSYSSFDADVAKAKAQLTGRAVTDYTTAMAKTIKPTAIKVKAVVQAQTDGAGVESVSPDGRQVTMVVFGEQKVTNSSLAAPRTDLFRVRATLDLVGGQWLVSKFDQI